MEIITGRTGTPHVYAADDAEIYKLFLGDGDFLLTTGNKLQATMNGTNEVRIADGSIMMQGRLAKIRPTDGFDSLTLDIGTTNYKRVDLVVAEYNQTTTTTEEEIEGEIVTITDITESITLKIVKGTPNQNQFVEPSIITGNIDLGETHQMKLWAVYLDGINFDRLVDYRNILDTTPIQTALDTATNSITIIETQMATLQTELYDYAEDLRQGIVSGFTGAYKETVMVSDASSAISVQISNYTYAQTDIIEVYLEGLRLVPTEYSATGSGNTLSITLTSGTFIGQMEVVVFKLSEAE